jgi:hypothetical protein
VANAPCVIDTYTADFLGDVINIATLLFSDTASFDIIDFGPDRSQPVDVSGPALFRREFVLGRWQDWRRQVGEQAHSVQSAHGGRWCHRPGQMPAQAERTSQVARAKPQVAPFGHEPSDRPIECLIE